MNRTLPMIVLIATLAALAVLALGGCVEESVAGSGDAEPSGRLVITGSSTAAPLVSEIGRRFEALYPGVRVDVQTGGSSRGIVDPVAGLADLGMSSRALTDAERDGRIEHLLARDGVAFLVHADNPLQAIPDERLRAILTGGIDDWSELGGAPGAITLVSRADGRSELDLVTGHFDLTARDIDADLIAGENQQAIKLVAGDPHAITFMSIGAAQHEIARGVSIRMLPLAGTTASMETVAAGSYPLGRPLNLITAREPSPLVQLFLAYAMSADVHDLVRELSFVPAS
jgi:phosphate transport system substrate-binding protein